MTDGLSSDEPVSGISSWLVQRLEPRRLWITHRPRTWSASDRWWTNLAARSLGFDGTTGPPALETIGGEGDLLYLPTTAEALWPARDEIADRLMRAGRATLVQISVGQTAEVPEGGTIVYDPLAIVLDGEVARLEEIPAGSSSIWPLISGVTTDPELWEEACLCLSRSGVSCVQPLAPTLSATDRRRLAEALPQTADHLFEALFHGPLPSERDFAAVAHRYGLRTSFRRPPSTGSERKSRNREVAEILALAAETWSELGRSEAQGQVLFQAARWAEDTPLDIRAITREGNLAILDWLRSPALDLVKEWAEEGTSSTLDGLRVEYCSPPAKGEQRHD